MSHMRTAFILLAAVAFLIPLAFAHSAGVPGVQFKVPITLTNTTESHIVFIGVSGDGTNPPGTIQDNTIGADTDPSFGDYTDTLAPPPSPAPYNFDWRILTIPGRVSTYPIGLSGGVYADFRGFTSTTQVDSFKINMTGDFLDSFDTQISWPSGLNALGTSWVIKPQSGTPWPLTNMLTSTSVTIPAGTANPINAIIIKTGLVLGVQPETSPRPTTFSLLQNYPNPFNPTTEIQFSVAKSGRATLHVYNLLGQVVATLFDGVAETGKFYHVTVDGGHLASGMYLYRLTSADRSDIRKMLLVK